MPIPIGTNSQTTDPVHLSHLDRFTGTYIVGKMGMGKSTLIQSLVADQLASGHGFCVIEPKGDLVEDILALIPTARERDVVLLDYGDEENPPGFDIFDATKLATIQEKAVYIREVVNSFEKTLGDQSWGSRMETVIMAIAATFAENPGTTLVQIERLFDDDAFRRQCYRQMTSITAQSARRFWDQYDKLKGKDTYVDSVLTKVRRFLFDPMLLAITCQAGKSFDFDQAIQKRQIVLISLPEHVLGAKGVDLLGTLYLSRIRLATQRQFKRPETDRVPFFVYLDEFQRFASTDISSFIAEARGAKVGLTMAHQWRSQIEDGAVRTAPMAVGNTFCFQVTPEDAAVFARGFRYARMPETPDDPEPPRWRDDRNLTHFWGFLERALKEDARGAKVKFLRGRYYRWLDVHNKTPGEVQFPAYETQLTHKAAAYLWEKNHGHQGRALVAEGHLTDAATATEAMNTADKIRGEFISYSEDVIRLGESLAHSPVDVHGRRETPEWWEWRKRQLLRPRYPETASTAEIAKGLTQLPNFVTHCKLHQGKETEELTVSTSPVTPDWELADVDAIRERCRADYCLPMADALALVEEQQGMTPVEPEVVLLDSPPTRF